MVESERYAGLNKDGAPLSMKHIYHDDGTETVITGDDVREAREEEWKEGLWYDIETYKGKTLLNKSRKLYHSPP
jgi:hypothetical protein